MYSELMICHTPEDLPVLQNLDLHLYAEYEEATSNDNITPQLEQRIAKVGFASIVLIFTSSIVD